MDKPAPEMHLHTYELLASKLKTAGVTKLFGLMSEDTAQLIATLDAMGVRFYSARHENNAIAMAEGYAAATGELAVALIGRGPATANGLHAASYASRTGSRLLILMGDAPLISRANRLGPDTKRFRSVDVLRAADLAVFQPTSPAAVLYCLADAVTHANRGTAAVLLLPTDLQQAKQSVTTGLPLSMHLGLESGASQPPARDAALDTAAALLARAKRPMILAGKGAWESGAHDALVDLADRTGAILSTTLKAKDMFFNHPFHVGMVGSFSFGIGRRFFQQADCIIAFGAGLNQRTTSAGKALPTNVPLIQVDRNRASIGQWFHADVGVVGDARHVAEQLVQRLETTRKTGFHTSANRELIQSFDRNSEFVPANTSRTLDPRTLGIALNRIMPVTRRVAYDAGNFLGVLPYIDVPSPAHLKNASEFGSIGLGLATALGFAEGVPDTPTYLFVGDGGLLMALGELETLARENIPLVIFVMNDCAYGAETHFLRHHEQPVSKSIFADIDFADLAGNLGLESATIRNIADLEHISHRLQQPEGPMVIDCKLNGQVAAAFTADHG